MDPVDRLGRICPETYIECARPQDGVGRDIAGMGPCPLLHRFRAFSTGLAPGVGRTIKHLSGLFFMGSTVSSVTYSAAVCAPEL
jgi:hypothetical protein